MCLGNIQAAIGSAKIDHIIRWSDRQKWGVEQRGPLCYILSSMPFFSVIVPTYNRKQLCRAAVESVLGQQFTDFELIVVDDGSTDGTSEALAHYGNRLRLIRQENRGQSAARNSAIGVATGEYVVFLDSDDQLFPWTLEILQRTIVEAGHPAVVAGNSLLCIDRPATAHATPQPLAMVRFGDLLEFFAKPVAAIFPTGALVVRTEKLKSISGFAPTRHNAEDIDLCLRLGTAPGFVRLLAPALFAKFAHDSNIGLDLPRSVSGLKDIYARERAGEYPGGAERRRARLALITLASRKTIADAARQGHLRPALTLYRQCLAWNLRLGKLRFVIGLPLIAAARWMRTSRKK